MQKYIILILLSLTLNAQNSEERFYKDKTAHADGFGLHTDVGYGSYLIELDSSELNSAIDYDVLEFTLGATYSYDRWMFGCYGKFLLKELGSNMFVVTTQEKLGDQATIDKNEFAFYANYSLVEKEFDSWRVNFIYRYSMLSAYDSYNDFYSYSSSFDYTTHGLALSLLYNHSLSKKHSWFTQVGVLYTQAKVEMSESVNGYLQDSFVDDRAKAWGGRGSIGYVQLLNKQLFFILRVDGWRLDFGKLKVSSRVGDTLPKAQLKEDSFSSYMGLSWRF
jgi:hypothetical protein